MEMRYYLATFLTAFILSSTEASKAAGKVKIKSRSPVYFPVIPIGSFDDDFGSRVAESISHSRRVPATKGEQSPPVSVQKITTTTEKLPLAQESHVASNSITEAPGPAYLTDSLYYNIDPTPDPLEEGDYDEGYINIQHHQDSSEDGGREGEVLGVYLQSLLSYEPLLFSKNRDSFDLLINPAKMHYIPPNSGELEENSYTAEVSAQLPANIPSPKIPTSETAEYSPPSQTVSFYEVQKHTASPVIETKPPNQKPKVVSSIQNSEKFPELYRAPNLVTKVPIIKYEAPTRPPSVIRIKPTSSKREQSSFSAVPSIIPPSTSSSQSLFVKSSDLDLIMAKPAATLSGISSRSPSSRYLPKPASNPFASRISQPVVKPVHGSGDKVEILNFSSNRKHSSVTAFSPIEAVAGYRSRLADTPQRSSQTNGNENSGRKHFGERKTRIDKTVEIYVPRTSLEEDQNILFESRKRDYGFGFNSPSGSAPRRQYKTPSVTLTPILEAPVYRTSTKSYRAPSSLFQAKETVGKPVTAPSQPEFIQTDANIYVPQEYDENAIPGVGGVDYPNFASIPSTEFKCSAQEHPGLYADQATKCQVFHICQEGGREDSFLCPNGTVFNQQYFVCDWWYNFSCESADRFYSLNALIYELPDSIKYFS